jgi:hypothetical protein
MFAASKTDSASTGGYQISRSLRFNSADSASLNRTPASAGNRKTWTWSGWVKLSKTSFNNLLEVVGPTTPSTRTSFMVQDQNNIAFFTDNTTSSLLTTTQVFRDFSAWYHIVLAVDTTQATAANRVKIYVNGSQITAFSTANYPAQNLDTQVNNTQLHTIGQVYDPFYANMYLTEINFIDGQALTPSSFGETNAQTGVWQPKAYSGSYGTNGFYLNFSDNSNTTAATLGKDYSGNGNNWTPNNFSVTAGAGNDSLVDSPTSYGTDTGVGGTVRGNYGTLNPLFNATTLTNGNLDASLNAISTTGTFGSNSGKWYFECTFTSLTGTSYLGIADQTLVKSDSSFSYSQVYVYLSNSQKGGNGGSATYGSSYTTGDVIGVAYDLDSGSITFYKNGTSQGVAYSTGFTSGYFWRPFLYCSATTTATFNFGQRPFAYTSPSGFKALCTQNLPTPTIGATTATQAGKFFNPVLYTGTGSARSVTGVGFQPDWVWTKERNSTSGHYLTDAVRGNTKILTSELTDAEATSSNAITSFNSDGFSLGTDAGINQNGITYVGWNWKANGSGSSNTAGSITSTVSANTTSGFSVVTYTGNGTANATVGHGIGVAPKIMFIKSRNQGGSSSYNWTVYTTATGSLGYLYLNTTDSINVFGPPTQPAPTSTVFSLGNGTGDNQNTTTYVAYCFAEVAGYSKFGSYTGNGSTDGPFVFTGMRPAYVMVKRTDTTSNWVVMDTARDTYNVAGLLLRPNLSDAESDDRPSMDFLSNGFKWRATTAAFNASGGTYIFAAFASAPQKFSLAR